MVSETDIQVYDPNDWEIQVDGIAVVSPIKFEITPEFSADVQLIETLYGEVGFSKMDASTKGTARITVPATSPSVRILADMAKARKVVTVTNFARANAHRYSKKRLGLTYAILKPAQHTMDKQAGTREFEAIGFGYFET